MTEPTSGRELRQWIADWRDGLFDSGSRDAHGWPIEMHGLVADLEALLDKEQRLREIAERTVDAAISIYEQDEPLPADHWLIEDRAALAEYPAPKEGS